MFLIISKQYVDADNPDSFMDYWWKLEMEDVTLTQKESMRNLHDARNRLKHQLIRPTEEDIEVYRATVERFFEENTPTVFGTDYGDIDLFSLVEFDTTRKKVSEAKEYLTNGETRNAAIALDDAFDDLMYEYKERGRGQLEYTPYPQRRNIMSERSYSDDVQEWIDTSKTLFDDIYSELQILSLGIDYTQYSRFNSIVRDVRMMGKTDDDFEKDEIKFGIQFVTRAALKLQQTQLDLTRNFQHPRTRSFFDW
ncbi:hypothetical protein GCM10009039_21520 [Halocalculus aciditolerans]|uniref:Uncharacterized protein n=2 Tax=Halocalculus aciditolerans TaxID=1383812 RepID=A0A830F7V3_9EURY|nr:hypothetical protein GCM10009039_21520 [Halocalculus aciditolerans]